jgi:hypothetical protein
MAEPTFGPVRRLRVKRIFLSDKSTEAGGVRQIRRGRYVDNFARYLGYYCCGCASTPLETPALTIDLYWLSKARKLEEPTELKDVPVKLLAR